MGKNNAKETADKMIRSAHSVFNEKMTDIYLFDVKDEPYSMFSIKFFAYEYLPIQINYDRGHLRYGIVFGEDTVPIECNIKWDDNCDHVMFWNKMDKDIRLRIPDKFLKAHGWL